MANEQKDHQTQKTPVQIGLWLVIGAGVGFLLGIFFNNIAMGITFGAALGLIFGAALSHKNKKK
ncbi:MAG: hypothetical protein RBS68_16395 [Anaerolineales bacterium]|nr:hypothetical protein [Anaerolineales bacterium]